MVPQPSLPQLSAANGKPFKNVHEYFTYDFKYVYYLINEMTLKVAPNNTNWMKKYLGMLSI
jgi:hypothetical protein